MALITSLAWIHTKSLLTCTVYSFTGHLQLAILLSSFSNLLRSPYLVFFTSYLRQYLFLQHASYIILFAFAPSFSCLVACECLQACNIGILQSCCLQNLSGPVRSLTNSSNVDMPPRGCSALPLGAWLWRHASRHRADDVMGAVLFRRVWLAGRQQQARERPFQTPPRQTLDESYIP